MLWIQFLPTFFAYLLCVLCIVRVSRVARARLCDAKSDSTNARRSSKVVLDFVASTTCVLVNLKQVQYMMKNILDMCLILLHPSFLHRHRCSTRQNCIRGRRRPGR